MEEKRRFYKELGMLAMPIIIQSLLSSAIGSLDTFMLNLVGQTQLSAVSLANQLFFVLSLFFTGLTGSTATMIAQYLGKNDKVKADRVFGIACKMSMVVSTVFAVLAFVLPSQIMSLLTNETDLVEEGSIYLRIVGISYLFMGFSQIYLTMLKSLKKTRKSMFISIITLLLNFVLNAGFILGLFGLPKLEVKGVAIFVAVTYTVLCGIFPAGGDTGYGLYIDGIVMWSLVIAGSIAAFVFKWNPIWVFVVLNIDESVKTPFVIRKYYKWDWVKNITRELEDEQ